MPTRRARIDPWTGREYPPSGADTVLAVLGMVLVAGAIVTLVVVTKVLWFVLAFIVLLLVIPFTRGRSRR